MRVLGIDPGLTRCGVGVVEGSVGRPLSLVDVGVVRTAAEMPIEERLCLIAAGLEEWLDATRPDAVAVERVFSQHNVKTVMGTAQASGIALLVAARRGLPVTLHTPSEVKASVTGSGRADKAQVGAMVTRLLRLVRGAQARRRGRRAGAGDLPHLAGRREQPHRGGSGGPEVCAQACPDSGSTPVIAFVRGQVAAVGLTSAVLEVGGVGLELHCTPDTLAGLRIGSEATLPSSMVVREDSLTLFGFADEDEKQMFELVQTASGVGPKLAQAMLAVHRPEALRRAVSSDDVKTLTTVPGIGQKGAQRIILELRDRIGAPSTTYLAPRETPGTDTWQAQVQAGLVGLGWSAKEAERAVNDVRPEAEQMATPDVARLLRAALRTLSKA